MSTAGLFVLLAILAGSVTFIVWPLIAGDRTVAAPGPGAPPSPLVGLRAEHEAILTSLRDLDFDFQTGKLIAADYQAQRALLVARGVETLQRIDALGSELAESSIAARREQLQAERPQVQPAVDARIEASIAARRRARSNEKINS